MVPRSAVKWETSLAYAQSGPCTKSRRAHKDRKVFGSYRDIFEQCFVKTELLAGRIGQIEMQPIISPRTGTKLERIMGRNKFCDDRILSGPELFAWYRKGGAFAVNVKRTRYWQSLSKRGASDGTIMAKVNKAVKMYRRMRAAKGLAPSVGGVWHSHDFPQVIDYLGYQKNMDGAHRRMVGWAVGLKELPCLVVRFDQLKQEDFVQSVPFLRDNWQWFHDEVYRYDSI